MPAELGDLVDLEVGTYRTRLAEKMCLSTDAELTAYVFRHHLLE